MRKTKEMLLMKEIGAFIPVSGMRIFIQAIHSLFNLGEAWEFYMSNPEWLRMEFVDQNELFSHIKNLFITNLSALWSILKLYQKIQKQIQQKLEKAVEKQRNGDLRGYAQLISEVNQLEDQLLELEKEEK